MFILDRINRERPSLEHLELKFGLNSEFFNKIPVTGLEIATDTVANATNIFSLATENSSLVAKLATRSSYDLDLN